MELSIVVFLLGSLLSYFPLYRLFDSLRLLHGARERPPYQQYKVTGSGKEFIETLQQEAATRTATVVRAASARLHDPVRSDSMVKIDAHTLRRLEETRGMIQALLPRDTIALFDRIVLDFPASNATNLKLLVPQLEARLVNATGSLPPACPLSHSIRRNHLL